MKKHACINGIIAMHKECSVLYQKDIIVLSVVYFSGRTKHYFPKREKIPEYIKAYIETSLQYYPTKEMTIYKYGHQYGY